MARQIFSFAVTVPAGTTKAAPATTPLSFPTRSVDEVEILVPRGPSGAVGFALGVSGSPIIPYNAGQWIVADNEVIHWPLVDYPDSGAWSITAYNTGAYDHTLYVRFLASLASGGAPVVPAPLDFGALSGIVAG